MARALLVSFVCLLLLAPAAAARDVYVTNSNSNNVSVFSTGSSTTSGTIPVGVFPDAVAISPDGNRAYVLNREFGVNKGTVSVVNTTNNTIVGSPIPVGFAAFAEALTPDGSRLYVANRNDGTVSVIDTTTNSVVGSPITVGTNPRGVAVTPDGKFVYVANGGSANVTVISTATNTPVGTVNVGNGPFGVVVTPDGSTVYVSNQTDGSVTPINTASNLPGTPITPGGPFPAPIGLAMARSGSFVYVVARNTPNSSIRLIDTATNSVTSTTIPTGDQSLAMALTPSGKTGFVTNGNSGNVSVLDLNTNTAGTPVTVNNGPLGVAVVPDQGPTAAFNAGKGAPNVAVQFDASGSTEGGGDGIGTYNWNFGDGSKLSDGGPTPKHTFTKAGTYQVSVTEFSTPGCGPNLVFTGQTAYCMGNPASTLTKAVTVPQNAFSFGKVKLNKKKGTAKLPVTVHAGGKLVLKGNQVKTQRPARVAGAAAKTVKAKGTYKLSVIPKSKVKKKLKKKGSYKVKVKVVFTPTGGLSKSKTKTIKLVRKK